MARFTGHKDENWGDFLDVKENYLLPQDKFQDKNILIGSSTDPYNHFERQFEKTRSILEHLAGSTAHIEILTKSPLVVRDIDVLSQIKDISVGFSLSGDDELARIIELAAPPPSERIKAMCALHEAGIKVYAFISPIIPYFSDYHPVVKAVEKYVSYIGFENLNLRGCFKQKVLDVIREHFPHMAQRFASIYCSRQAFYRYWRIREKEIHEFMQTLGHIPYKTHFFHDDTKK
jgi:DNA repair photolyase